MNEAEIRKELNKRIWKTENPWITKSIMNQLIDQGIEVINKNLEQGNIKKVDDKLLDHVAFKLIDQLH